MRDANVGKSVGSTIICMSCGATRGMAEAQGAVGREKLPQKCRGRHPHLNAFDTDCDARPALIMMGASNLWFGATQSIIVMPRNDDEKNEAARPTGCVSSSVSNRSSSSPARLEVIRALAGANKIDLSAVSVTTIWPPQSPRPCPRPDSEEQRTERRSNWDPVELLIPEWRYLQKPALFPQQPNTSGLMVTEMPRGPELHATHQQSRGGRPDEEGQCLPRIHPA